MFLFMLLQLDDGASVNALMLAIQLQLGVPLEQQRISRDAALLTAKGGQGIRYGRGWAAGGECQRCSNRRSSCLLYKH
jgi:hypothetical protein